jgi:CheY-like chemotaxis protein
MTKVLLIDDEPAILKMYTDSLEGADYEVITASTGEDGVNEAKKSHPDVIFLDIIMPKLNGLDALKSLKSDPETKNIPVYLLTNLPENASGGKPNELGAAGYLVKAELEPDKLVEIVKGIEK